MDNDEIAIFDVERLLLDGEIRERQRDTETGEWKYIINGFNFWLLIEAEARALNPAVLFLDRLLRD